MGTGYTRNDTANNIADGNIINASDLDGEFDAVEAAFNSSTGHTHDGTAAEGGAILVLGPSQEFVASATEVKPSTNAGLSLGTSLLQFNNLYIDGTANIDTLAGASVTADLNFTDNTKAVFGAGSDLQIYHDGSNSIIKDAGTGNLKILGTSMNIQSATEENYIEAVANSHVKLFYDAAEKLATTSTGVDITGNATFDDNGKAIFGAGSDLQIYHDGNSWIKDTGQGNLVFDTDGNGMFFKHGSETLFEAYADGAVNLRHDDSTKLATTSTGVDITGTLTSDGLTVETASGATITVKDTGRGGLQLTQTGGGSGIINVADANEALILQTNSTNRMNIANNGDISFYEDTGTTPKFFWDASAESLGIGTSSGGSWSSTQNQIVVGDGSGNHGITVYSDTAGKGILRFSDGTTGSQQYRGRVEYDHANDRLELGAGAITPFVLDSSGNVGIGTSSPKSFSGQTHVTVNHPSGGTNVSGYSLRVADTEYSSLITYPSNSEGLRIATVTALPMTFQTNNAERMRIDSSGNVGIGTSSPSAALDVVGTALLGENRTNATAKTARLGAAHYTTSEEPLALIVGSSSASDNTVTIGGGTSQFNASTSVRFFTAANTTTTGGSERMRIDSSGNLLVGRTSSSGTAEGIRLLNDGFGGFHRNNAEVIQVDRKTSDGDIAVFRKDGSTVGSIGAYGGDVYIGTGDAGLWFQDGGNAIRPFRVDTQVGHDASIDLGHSTNRFKDLFLSGGVYLGGTGSANKLDDYQQGDFTPTWDGYTPASTAGAYVRIGQLVYVSMKLVTASSADYSGVQVNNLPFTIANETAIGGGMVWADNANFYDAPNFTQLLQNTTQCILKTINSSNTYSTREYVGRNPQIGASTNFTWNIIYRTND